MKRIFSFVALCVMTLGTQVTAYNYLTVTNTDGSQQSIDVTAGLTITFADGNMIATDGTTTTTLALSSLASMAFTAEASAVEDLVAEVGGNAQVQVYSMDGKLIRSVSAKMLQQGGMDKGVYIVKTGTTTKKVMIK